MIKMELIFLLSTLMPLLLVTISANLYHPNTFEDKSNSIFYEESSDEDDFSNRIITFDNSRLDTRTHESEENQDVVDSRGSEFIDWDNLDVPQKEKKNLHHAKWCINEPTKKKILEQNDYDFNPHAVVEYNCKDIPSPGLRNPLLIPENAMICKVVDGVCESRHREIRIFRKHKFPTTSRGQCWEKVSYNLSVGCKCMSHIHHQL